MTMSPATDEELVAYLDGEIAPERYEALRVEIDRSPDLRRRLDNLKIDRGSMLDAFEALGKAAPPMPALPQKTAEPPRPRLWLVAASLVCGLAIGSTLALVAGGQKPGWQQYVASYQALYVNRTLSHIDLDRDEQTAELSLVADAIGKGIDLDVFTDTPDLDYKRAQILGFEGRPLVQFAFLSKVGEPMALCVIRTDAEQDVPVASGTMEGLSTASWTRDGYGYLLIGGTDDGIALKAARHFSALL